MTLAPLAASTTITASVDVAVETTFYEGDVIYDDNVEFVCIDNDDGCTKDTIGSDETKWIEADPPLLEANITEEQAESLANGNETRCSQWRKGTTWQEGQLACFKKSSWKCLNATYCASLKPGGRRGRAGLVWQDMNATVPVDRKALREIADTKDAMKFAEKVKYREGQTIVSKGLFFECENPEGCKGLDPISDEAEKIWKIVEDIAVDPPESEKLGEIKEWKFGDESTITVGELVKTDDGTAMKECLDPELCKSIPPGASKEDTEGVWREIQAKFIDLKLPKEELIITLYDALISYTKDEIVKDDSTGQVFECIDEEKCNETPTEESEGWKVKPEIEAPTNEEIKIIGKYYYWDTKIDNAVNPQWWSVMPGDLIVLTGDSDKVVMQAIDVAKIQDYDVAELRLSRDKNAWFVREDLTADVNVVKRPSPVLVKKAAQVYEPGTSVLEKGSEWMIDDDTHIVKRVVKECLTNDCEWDSDVFALTRLYGVVEDPEQPTPTANYNDWIKGAMYLAGDIVIQDNKLYECCQSCAKTPDIGLEMSCQWLNPRDSDSAWDSIINKPGKNLYTAKGWGSKTQECVAYEDTIWAADSTFTDSEGQEIKVNANDFAVGDHGCWKGRVFECLRTDGGLMDDCNTIDPKQGPTKTLNNIGEIMGMNWDLKRTKPEPKEIEKPREIGAFNYQDILKMDPVSLFWKTGDVLADQVKDIATVYDFATNQEKEVEAFIESQRLFKCKDSKRCAMINPFKNKDPKMAELAWEELEGVFAITKWYTKKPAPTAECLDWDAAKDPWAEVKVNFKTGQLACVGDDRLFVFRCVTACNEFRPMMWDGTFNSKYWSFEPLVGELVEPVVKPELECVAYDPDYPYISGDKACLFGVPFFCDQDTLKGSCTEMKPDLKGEDTENVWVLLEGFRTEFEIKEVEPEPFEVIRDCPHWEQIAYDADSHVIVTDTTKDLTVTKERADITDKIVCEDKVAFKCLVSKSCYEASPSQWKEKLIAGGLDADYSPWKEIRAYGDNTEDTAAEKDDWKPKFEDETGDWFDCIKDASPDASIKAYSESGYNIVDGQVCLDPESELYPELKKFFQSHQTFDNIDIDKKYDDYVYSNYDDQLLSKNIKVLSYALTELEFETIMYEAIMQGEVDALLDVKQAYFDFMFAAAHIPAFCGEKSPEDPRDMIEVCRNEIAMFFLDITANSRFDEKAKMWTGITDLEDPVCKEAVMDLNYAGECDNFKSMLALDEKFLDTEGAPLYRRGFGVGIEGVEDYAALSAIVYGDRTILLREPWLVTEDLSLAFGAALYKWMQRNFRVAEKRQLNEGIRYPSGHEIATGLWAGNEKFPTQDPNTLIELSLNQNKEPKSCKSLSEDELEQLIGTWKFLVDVVPFKRLPESRPFTCTPFESFALAAEIQPAVLPVFFDYDEETNSCKAVDYPTIFKAWVPKDFKRCVKVNDQENLVEDLQALEETLKWQGDKCFEWTFDYASFCATGDKICGFEPSFYYEVTNPLACAECKPGACKEKEWYKIVNVEKGAEVYPGEEQIKEKVAEIEIIAEANVVFPLIDSETGVPVLEDFVPVLVFWSEIDDRVIKCMDESSCIQMYMDWKKCVSDPIIDATTCKTEGWEFTKIVKKAEQYENWGEFCLVNDAIVPKNNIPVIEETDTNSFINEFGDVCIFFDDIFNLDPSVVAWMKHSSQLYVLPKFAAKDEILNAFNVKLMDSFFSEKDFNQMFPYALENQLYTYKELRIAVGAMPAFLNRNVNSDDEVSWERAQNEAKRELAAFLAHTIGNTNKFERATPDSDGQLIQPEYTSIRQGLYRMFWKDCPQNEKDLETAILTKDTSCMGMPVTDYTPTGYDILNWYRPFGPMMISGAYNYHTMQALFSPMEWINGDIMENPELATEFDLVWLMAVGNWMTGADRAPSGHAIISGYWRPEMAEKDARIGRGFGATLAAYHPDSCGKGNGRLKIMEVAYKNLLNRFGWKAPEGFVEKTNCEESLLDFYPENVFTFGAFWAPNNDGTQACYRQDKPTDYSVYQAEAYAKCVSNNFELPEPTLPEPEEPKEPVDPNQPEEPKEPIVDPKEPEEPTEPIVDPKEPEEPTEPIVDPKEPEEPTEPIVDPKEPEEPTEPIVDPKEPEDPTEPIVDPKEPEEPTEPIVDPNAPEEPKEPIVDPNEPEEPKEPIVDPKEPEEPTEPIVDPNAPEEPKEPIVDPEEPKEPIVDPKEPEEPTEPIVDPNAPEEPKEPIVDPEEPKEPIQDPEEPKEPIVDPEEPKEPMEDPTKPVEPTDEPTEPTDEPKDPLFK